MNVILLVIDTLRADHLGCYGYHRDTSPTLDAIARDGVLFERAYASDVPTQPSYTSMFTGLRGIHTGVVSHSDTETLSEEIPTLAEILAGNGVATASVSTLYTMRRWFARGFRHNVNPAAGDHRKIQQVDAEEINAEAIPWLREHRGDPFFLFLHYWDPHGLYKPPEEYRRLFYDGDETDPGNRSLDPLKNHAIWSFTKRHVDAIDPELTDLEYVIAQYDAEIRYADDQLRLLLDALEDQGIADETAIIITSDHGESLGEHNLYFDHFAVYDTTIQVPLILRTPQGIHNKISEPVQSTTSLAPTIFSLFGLDPPDHMKGENLVSIAEGETPCPPEVYSNQGLWTAKRAIIRDGWKLIRTTHKSFWDTPERELYRIQDDPLETRDLAEEEPEIADSLDLRMARWLREELGGKADPLDLIVTRGLPVYDWVEIVAKTTGLYETYEEWRTRVDRGEPAQKRTSPPSPPRW